jgi:hypothetical protein
MLLMSNLSLPGGALAMSARIPLMTSPACQSVPDDAAKSLPDLHTASKAAKSFRVVAVGAGNASEIGRDVLSPARLRA